MTISTDYFSQLPKDLFGCIFSYLDIRDLCRFTMLSRRHHENANAYWELFALHFYIREIPATLSLREICKSHNIRSIHQSAFRSLREIGYPKFLESRNPQQTSHLICARGFKYHLLTNCLNSSTYGFSLSEINHGTCDWL